MRALEVLFTPAEFDVLSGRDLSETQCVVFDILRATTTMVTALANGAKVILPVSAISEALDARRRMPNVLLAGEREGVRIGPELAQGTTFDLGNSPREFTPQVVEGRTIVMTTTNGTRALHACQKAPMTLASSFLNIGATAEWIRKSGVNKLLLVCSGTHDQAAYEDTLCAGAICDLVWKDYYDGQVADSAHIARELFLKCKDDLMGAMAQSRNARRLLSIPDLKEDVGFCLQRDTLGLVAVMAKDGRIHRQ